MPRSCAKKLAVIGNTSVPVTDSRLAQKCPDRYNPLLLKSRLARVGLISKPDQLIRKFFNQTITKPVE